MFATHLSRLRVSGLHTFDFSDSHLVWGNELDQILIGIYASMVRKTKDDIREVARDFHGQLRVYRLFHHTEDLVKRRNALCFMLSIVRMLIVTAVLLMTLVIGGLSYRGSVSCTWARTG